MKSEKIGWIAVTGFVLLALLTLCKLYTADFALPWNNTGDILLTAEMIQSIAEGGWVFESDRLGMPFGHQMYDFPMTDLLHFLAIRVLLWFSADWATVLNMYFVLTFFLTAWSAYWAGRRIGLTCHWAVATSVLFTFLPYHFLRAIHGHYFLAAYYMVPPIMVVCIWLARGKYHHFSRQKRRIVIGTIICLLVSMSGIYYAFFSCFFLLTSALIGWVRHRCRMVPVLALVLVAVICLGVAAQLVPNLWYYYQEGRNVSLAQRSPAEAEIYGLKITQLFLPTWQHRIGWFRKILSHYNETTPLVNENSCSMLGLFGAIGCFLLLAFPFLQGGLGKTQKWCSLRQLAQINLAAILLATIGGGGSVFAWVISPQIRAYNRISVFIGLVSLWAIAIFLHNTLKEINGKNWLRWSKSIAVVVLILGTLDQIPVLQLGSSPAIRKDFESDRAFFHRVESELPSRTMIFQLPYVPFPENPPVNRMQDYEHFRAYLHSSNLRWSYGAMKGRFADQWQSDTSRLPVPQMLENLALAGFNGVYIDRNGYEDGAKKLENELRRLLKVAPIQSDNGRLLFFSMQPYVAALQSLQGEKWWRDASARMRQPVIVEWGKGFSAPEKDAHMQWRWADKNAKLFVRNFGSDSREIQLTMVVASGYPNPSQLVVTVGEKAQQYTIDSKGQRIVLHLHLPPGRTRINFQTDAPRVHAPTDSRFLYFRAIDFQLTIASECLGKREKQ